MLQTLGRGMSIATSANIATTIITAPSLLASYPIQTSGEAAVSNDFDLDDASAWALSGDWTDNGNGTFSKSGNASGWSSYLTQSFTFDDNKEYASVLNISENSINSQGVSFDTQPGSGVYNAWPRGVAIHVSKVSFDSGDTSFRYQAGIFWQGAISQAGLFDITGFDNMPVHILMVAGQSNAIGFGQDGMDPEKDNWHPRIWCLPGGDFNNWSADDTTLDIANDPIQYQEQVNNQVSPAMAAARRIVAAHPNHRVVIVPMAKQSTDLIAADAFWNPNTTLTNANQKMFDRLKARYNAAISALSGVTVASVSLMWSQGEADGAAAGYEAAFTSMRSQLMTDLSLAELPTVILGRTIIDVNDLPDLAPVQQKLDQDSGDAAAINDVVYFDLAGSEWANVGDEVHFTTEGQRIRGDYAGQLLAHRLSNSVGVWPGPRVMN